MQFLSYADLAARRRTSVRTERRRIQNDPRHPRPVKLSPNRVGFPEPEADAYDLLLIAERDAALAENGKNKPADAPEAEIATA